MFFVTRLTNKWSLVSVALAGSVFLSGCGGSNAEDIITDIFEVPAITEVQPVTVVEIVSPPAAPVAPIPVLNVALSGRLVDAVSGVPLSGATVNVTVPGVGEQFSANTDADGSYEILSAAGAESIVSFSLDGYQTEQYSSLDLVANNGRNLGTVRLVSSDNAGVGTLTGTISNAVNGSGVEGLTLRFRQGINVTSGDVVATATTDFNGDYVVNNLPYGNLTCEIVGAGFNTSFANVIALGNITQADQNSAVSPNLSTGEIRIVLTWGATPSDLDSHLTGPQENSDSSFHVFYARSFSDLVNLDVDDVSSFGPETVTIERQINGTYRYTVYNFSNNSDTGLSASGARVQVFDDGGLIRDYQVPDGVGNLWTVFDMEGGNITTVNTISTRTSDAQHFPPGEQPKTVAEVSTRLYK